MRWFFVAVICLAPSISSAQAPKRPSTDAAAPASKGSPPVSSVPQTTSASYGDWVLVCQRASEESTQRLCEVAQSIQVQGQPAPIARLAISKANQPAATQLIVVLPTNVTLTSAPHIAAEEKDPQGVELAWVRCLSGGCFASASLKDDVLAKWRALDDRGRLQFKDGAGRALALPFSFRGLGDAYDALAKEVE